MLQARKTWMAAVVALAALAAGPASAAPLLGIKGGGEDADKWLVNDPEVVLTINVKQMTTSKLLQANLPTMKDMIKSNEEAKQFFEATGLDPFKDVENILISGSGGSAKDAKGLFVIRGKFDTKKIHAAVEKEAKKNPGEMKLVKEGDVQLYEVEKGEQKFVAGFASSSVLVATNSKEATLEAIKHGGKKAAKIGKEMKAALSKFTGKETMTLAVVINDDLKKLLEKAPKVGDSAGKLKLATASLVVTDSVALNLTGVTTEAKAAKSLGGALTLLKAIGQTAIMGMEELPPVLGEMLEAVKIANKDMTVTIDLKVSKEMIQKAQKPSDK
jgi:hypothetical protein